MVPYGLTRPPWDSPRELVATALARDTRQLGRGSGAAWSLRPGAVPEGEAVSYYVQELAWRA